MSVLQLTPPHARNPIQLYDAVSLVPTDTAEATKEPEHHENEQDHAKNAAESSAAVAAVSVVPTATAK
jgi:hypothetical protein